MNDENFPHFASAMIALVIITIVFAVTFNCYKGQQIQEEAIKAGLYQAFQNGSWVWIKMEKKPE